MSKPLVLRSHYNSWESAGFVPVAASPALDRFRLMRDTLVKQLTPFSHYAMMDGHGCGLRLVKTEGETNHSDGRLVPRLPGSGIRHMPVCRVTILCVRTERADGKANQPH